MNSLKIIVLAKQVPDTRNVGKDAMKADGTVNRGALPAIFNPEDLHALEQALKIKDKNPETEIILLTMGPTRAAEIIREGLFRGVNKGILLTDKRFAGSDTLATSYALSLAIKKMAPYDLIICGRQAIDGDTAQVGPQIAQKLNLPQVTYTEEITNINGNSIQIKRRLERGFELVEAPLPLLITVHSSAPPCRTRHARLLMKYKRARSVTETQEENEDYLQMQKERPYLHIDEWNVEDIDADIEMLGLSGSPTKVKKVENVILQAKESKILTESDEHIDWLMKELIQNHTLG